MNQYTVTVTLEVDPEAPFLEIGETDNCNTILEIMRDMIYDCDYIKLTYIDVEFDD